MDTARSPAGWRPPSLPHVDCRGNVPEPRDPRPAGCGSPPGRIRAIETGRPRQHEAEHRGCPRTPGPYGRQHDLVEGRELGVSRRSIACSSSIPGRRPKKPIREPGDHRHHQRQDGAMTHARQAVDQAEPVEHQENSGRIRIAGGIISAARIAKRVPPPALNREKA